MLIPRLIQSLDIKYFPKNVTDVDKVFSVDKNDTVVEEPSRNIVKYGIGNAVTVLPRLWPGKNQRYFIEILKHFS